VMSRSLFGLWFWFVISVIGAPLLFLGAFLTANFALMLVSLLVFLAIGIPVIIVGVMTLIAGIAGIFSPAPTLPTPRMSSLTPVSRTPTLVPVSRPPADLWLSPSWRETLAGIGLIIAGLVIALSLSAIIIELQSPPPVPAAVTDDKPVPGSTKGLYRRWTGEESPAPAADDKPVPGSTRGLYRRQY